MEGSDLVGEFQASPRPSPSPPKEEAMEGSDLVGEFQASPSPSPPKEEAIRGEVDLPGEDASPGELDILGALDLLGEETSFGELEAEVTGVLEMLEAGAVNEAKAASVASGGEKVEAGAGDKAKAWKKKTRAVLLSGEDFKSFMACAPTRRERRFIPDESMSKEEAELRKKVAATAKEVDDFFARLREQYNRKGYALFGVEEYEY